MSFRSRNTRRFKKTTDASDVRRRRENYTIQLRESSKGDEISKRRQTGSSSEQALTLLDMKDAEPEEVKRRTQEALPALVAGLMGDDPEQQLQCCREFRKLLSLEREPPIELIVTHPGIVDRFVQLLRAHDPNLQFEAAWSLTNVASGTFEQTQCVCVAGAVPVLVELLSAENPKVRDQATWALGNIAGDSPQRRDEVLQSAVLEPLLLLLKLAESKEETVRNVTWTISNLCRGKPQPEFDLVEPALPYLRNLLGMQDVDVLTDACWALSYLSDDTGPYNQKIQAVLNSGCMPRLLELLRHPTVKVKTPALRAIGNIVTGDDFQTQRVINQGGLPRLLGLLNSARPPIRKETCWTISNITAGNQGQITDVYKSGIFDTLIQILQSDKFDIQKEATWAVSNACSGGSNEVIHNLVRMDVIPALFGMIQETSDAKIVGIAVGGIEKILDRGRLLIEQSEDKKNPYCQLVERCGGVEKLEHLTYDSEDDVLVEQIKDLLNMHWETVEVPADDAYAPGPSINNETNTFSFNPSGNPGGFNPSANPGGFGGFQVPNNQNNSGPGQQNPQNQFFQNHQPGQGGFHPQ